jgi:hypothetical protein
MFLHSRSGSKKPSIDFRASNQKYESYRIINKARVQFVAEDLMAAKQHVEKVVSDLSKKSIELTDQPSHGVYLFIVNQKDLNPILADLQTKGKILSKSSTTDTSYVNLDANSENDRLKSYEKEMQDLNQVRFPSEVQIRRKEALHGLISESRNRLERLQDVEDLLLYITVTTASTAKLGGIAFIQNMVINFGKWLLIYTVATILVYYGTKLLMYILALMGIKGLGMTGTNYGSNYGSYEKYTGKYSYGKDKKRKTKRIYKEKPKPEDTDNTTP